MNLIDAYTRADAHADGQLIEIPEPIAREAGFAIPVSVTAAAWADCVAWTDDDSDRKNLWTEASSAGRSTPTATRKAESHGRPPTSTPTNSTRSPATCSTPSPRCSTPPLAWTR